MRVQRLKRNNQRWRRYSRMLIQENRWRAQRYGYGEGALIIAENVDTYLKLLGLHILAYLDWPQ